MKSYSHFISESENRISGNLIENISSDILYNIANDDHNDVVIVAEAILELYYRDEVELSEEDLMELQTITPTKKSFNVDEPGTKTIKTSGGLVKFPDSKSFDNTKGMPLTGKTFNPIDTALRGADVQQKPVQTLIGPMGGAKSVNTSAKSSPRSVSSSSTNPVIPKSSASQVAKPTPKAVSKMASSARKPEADPNLGKNTVGVTSRAFGSKSAGVTSTQNRYGQGTKSTMLAPTPRKDVATGGTWVSQSGAPKASSSKPPSGGKWM